MVVSDKLVLFDLGDFPKLDRFNQWKLSRGKSIVTDYRKGEKMMRVTLHNLLAGSKFVRWINGDIFDFRKENIIPTLKSIRPRPCGVTLKGNEYKIQGTTLIIKIICKGVSFEALADYEDYPLISKHTWYINPVSGYVQTKERLGRLVNKALYLHRLVMGVSEFSTKIDHINGDKKDNRKINLRFCSNSQNLHNCERNRKGFIVGVTRVVRTYWEARIQINKVPRVKAFKTYEEALAQRRAWEQEFNPSGLNGECK